MAKILILENDSTGKTYRDYLSSQLPNHSFFWCRDIDGAKDQMDDSFSVVVLDQRLDNSELGTSFMGWCKATYPHTVGIMFSALATRAEVDKAFNNKWIVASVEKNQAGLIKLPEYVINAINESEYLKVAEKTERNPQLIGRIWRWQAPFAPIKVFKVSECIKDAAFVDDNTWKLIWERHAGQTTSQKKSQETTYSVKVNCDLAITAGISVDKIKEFVSKNLMASGEVKIAANMDYSEKSIHETQEQFVMPEVDADPDSNGLTMVKYESNRVFEVHLIGIKLYCPLCKYEKYITCEVFIPTTHSVKRKVQFYSDGSKKIIDI